DYYCGSYRTGSTFYIF
nr:immunoglobulin light chain junction region [Macaca mulatta]MOV95441.1 immunoglobulin light chain junction region [Macaca mulatta]MOV96432.1 immunoglobulin light chain junction region [Macaca mulatta]MOV96759.1 immunoglobulin light chain junction region [Macaca mulatta]MOV96763.1 immunoglobulin light chain junction region [Macaca mulatta]